MRTSRRGKIAAACATLALVAVPLSVTTSSANATDGPIEDPIPDPVKSSLGLVLEEVHQFPETEPIPDPTDSRLMNRGRINHVSEVPDESGRLAVPDLNGPLYLLDGEEEHTYLDFRDEPDFFSGAGLGSGFGFVSFHPEFAENGKFYTVHTARSDDLPAPTYTQRERPYSHSVVTEWTADDPSANTFSGSSREIMRLGFAGRIHAVQQIGFNTTAKPGDADYGLLYVTAGDGGAGTGTDGPQDPSTPFGKILRIDPEGTDGPNGEYGIPSDNPFVDAEGTLDEIYAIGMRDPHRFSWDPKDGRMFMGHIGQHAIEAIYEVRPGDNFGWAEREGRFVYNPADQCNLYPLPENDDEFGYTYPVAAFDHDPPAGAPCNADSGHAIAGGFAYRGDLRSMRGKYFFTDLVDGRVMWSSVDEMRQERGENATVHEAQLYTTDGERVRMHQLAEGTRVDLRFGQDADGELYLVSKTNAKMWKVVDVKRKAWPTEPISEIEPNLIAHYDFEHPFAPTDDQELDQGLSGQRLDLVNGGRDMIVDDAAYPAGNLALQTRQVNPAENGNDDQKAGVWNENGVESLSPFAGAEGITVGGWVKVDMDGPALNSTTADPDDRFNAIGLAGVLSGDSDGHGVRALLELIQVDGELRLVALGRRVDGGQSQTFAASQNWQELLPRGEWVHLTATFDYTTGEMALYRNGEPLDGFYTKDGDPWEVDGSGTSDTLPRGIKIGGSFPQDNAEQNPCDCRFDSLMFLDRVMTGDEVSEQYGRFVNLR